jgi:hypothetical protein
MRTYNYAMRSWHARILLRFLVMGALVNVAGVVVCSLTMRESPKLANSELQHVIQNNYRWKVRTWRAPTLVIVNSLRQQLPAEYSDIGPTGTMSLPLWASSLKTPTQGFKRLDLHDERRIIIARGWPLVSMCAEITFLSRSLVRPRYDVSGALHLSNTLEVDKVPKMIPYRPIWLGFLLSMMFYAAVLWIMWAIPFTLRKQLRRRRGLCAACAYPVGASVVCTECGSPVVPRSVEPT